MEEANLLAELIGVRVGFGLCFDFRCREGVQVVQVVQKVIAQYLLLEGCFLGIFW